MLALINMTNEAELLAADQEETGSTLDPQLKTSADSSIIFTLVIELGQVSR